MNRSGITCVHHADTTEVIPDVPDKTGVTLSTQAGLVLIFAIGCVFLLVTVIIVSIVFGILFKRRGTGTWLVPFVKQAWTKDRAVLPE